MVNSNAEGTLYNITLYNIVTVVAKSRNWLNYMYVHFNPEEAQYMVNASEKQ